MKFSVVIPIHNKLPHLERSISSVLNQTFQDFELILIDDASTDGSSEKIKEFKDSRISIYTRSEPGSGGYAARNLGIEKAQGEWVAFLDADDEWYLNHLEKMNELASKYPDVHFMSCGFERQKGGVRTPNMFYRYYKNKGSFIVNFKLYIKSVKYSPSWTSVACIKNKTPIMDNLFPAESGAKRGGDLYAWLKLICYHKMMAWSNHIGAIYHMESVNMVTKSASSSYVLTNYSSFKEVTKNLNNKEKKLVEEYFNFLVYLTQGRKKDVLNIRCMFANYYSKGHLKQVIKLVIHNIYKTIRYK